MTKFRLRIALFACVSPALLATVAPVYGDIPAPKPIEKKSAISVRVDAEAKKTRLVVPRSLLPVPQISQAQDRTRTLIAGLATASAVALGGLVFFRRKAVRTPFAVGLFGTTMLLAGTVCADLIPSRGSRPRPDDEQKADKELVRIGDAVVEFSDDAKIVTLIFDEKSFSRLEQAESIRDKR
ncbi:MAG: hypothetical protein JNL96_00235 [Planctomycetaceae bacterium]|nr:hypothetical protein [Planctomycetaceae bacterium]